jgi:protein-disulfide isomerase
MFKATWCAVVGVLALKCGMALGADLTPAPAATAAPPVAAATPPAAAQDPRVAILKLLPAGAKLEDLKPSPIPGIYEFAQDADVSYITADGKYFIDGNLYDLH